MKKMLLLVIFTALMTACNTSPQAAKNPVFGLLEVRIEGGEGLTSSATARFVNPDHLRQTRTLTSYPYYTNTNLSFFRRSVAFVDDNDQLATTDINTTQATRYVTATFNITNNTGTAFNNLYLVATSVPTGVDTTIGGTAFKTIQRGNGTLETSAAVAQKILPASGVSPQVTGVVPLNGATDLQYLTASETGTVHNQALAFSSSLDLDPLEYAFVAHNGENRNIAGTGGTGTVTLGYKLPKINPRNANAFAFVVYYVVVNDSVQVASQTPEEQPSLTLNTVFDTGSSKYRVLEGSNLIGRQNLMPLCSITIAQIRLGGGAYQKTLYNPVRNPLNFFGTPVIGEPSCDFGASGRRIERPGFYAVCVANDVVSDANGGIFVGGSIGTSPNRNMAIWKLNKDGSNDTSFAATGSVTADFGGDDVGMSIAYEIGTGRIMIVGTNGSDIAIARFLADGNLDTSFSGDGKLTIDLGLGVIEKANAIISVGTSMLVAGSAGSNLVVLKVLSAGNLDTNFGTNGFVIVSFGVTTVANGIALTSTGGMYVVGSYTSTIGNTNTLIVKLTPAGLRDTSIGLFGQRIIDLGAGQNDEAFDVVVYPDNYPIDGGKALLCGSYVINDLFHSSNAMVARLLNNGDLDLSFSSDGITGFGLNIFDTAKSIRFDVSSGEVKIMVAGSSDGILVGTSDFLLGRLLSDGLLDTTFSDDGMLKMDINNSNDIGAGLLEVSANDNDYLVAGTVTSESLSSFGIIRIEH